MYFNKNGACMVENPLGYENHLWVIIDKSSSNER